MPMGIPGTYDTNTSILDLLRGRNDPANQNAVQSTIPREEPGLPDNSENNQRLTLESNSTDSTANKHSRQLIDIMA